MREGTSNASWIREPIIIANMQILNSILNFSLLSSFSHRLLQNSLLECENAIKPQNKRWEPRAERQGLTGHLSSLPLPLTLLQKLMGHSLGFPAMVLK